MWGLWSTEIITFACRPCPDKGKATADVSLLATRRRARLYIGGVWIRHSKELHMKRLLGLLLGMVGCGGGDTPPMNAPFLNACKPSV